MRSSEIMSNALPKTYGKAQVWFHLFFNSTLDSVRFELQIHVSGHPGNIPRCTLHGKFGVSQVWWGFFGKEIEFLSLSGIESRFLKHPAHYIVTKHTMISRINYAVQCVFYLVVNMCFKIKRIKWNMFPCLISHKQVLLHLFTFWNFLLKKLSSF